MKYIKDISKYKKYCKNKNAIVLVLLTQGLWALFFYRLFNSVYKSKIPMFIKKIILLFYVPLQKNMECLTGISLPYSATIGEGFYIGHFGNIIIHPNSVIGVNCNISQGVTIGISGRGKERGVPQIGNNVYIGANAVLVGGIIIGDNCLIGANSLVVESVNDSATVLGVPAKVVNQLGSKGYI